MRAGEELGAHNGGLGADDLGEDGVERFPAAPVVVAVPRRPTEVVRGDVGAPEGGGDAGGVEGEGAVHLAELRLQRLHRAGDVRVEVERQVGRGRVRPPHGPPAALGGCGARPREEGGEGGGGGRHRRGRSNPHPPAGG